jgi:late competence protein required for DNA uptake (superfamily II DNA/RNA helicase)
MGTKLSRLDLRRYLIPNRGSLSESERLISESEVNEWFTDHNQNPLPPMMEKKKKSSNYCLLGDHLIENPVKLHCGHEGFCRGCIKRYQYEQENIVGFAVCPVETCHKILHT